MHIVQRRASLITAAFLLAADGAHAQGKRQLYGTAGFHVGSPQWVSVSLGSAFTMRCPSKSTEGLLEGCHVFTVDAEPGIGGGKVAVGYGRGMPLQNAMFARAVALRMWGSPMRLARNQTFLGAELRIQMLMVDITVGAFQRLTGPVVGHEDAITGTLGLELWW